MCIIQRAFDKGACKCNPQQCVRYSNGLCSTIHQPSCAGRALPVETLSFKYFHLTKVKYLTPHIYRILVRMSSSSLRPDGEPTVTATLAADDGVYEVSPRYGSVLLKG